MQGGAETLGASPPRSMESATPPEPDWLGKTKSQPQMASARCAQLETSPSNTACNTQQRPLRVLITTRNKKGILACHSKTTHRRPALHSRLTLARRYQPKTRGTCCLNCGIRLKPSAGMAKTRFSQTRHFCATSRKSRQNNSAPQRNALEKHSDISYT